MIMLPSSELVLGESPALGEEASLGEETVVTSAPPFELSDPVDADLFSEPESALAPSESAPIRLWVNPHKTESTKARSLQYFQKMFITTPTTTINRLSHKEMLLSIILRKCFNYARDIWVILSSLSNEATGQ